MKKPIILPPEADRIVVSAQLSPNQGFRLNWELAVIGLTEPMSLRAIARAEGGYVDTINGLPVVWTPSNAYFIQLDSKTMGVMSPANRQAVSRWAKFGKTNTTEKLSDYLSTAVGSLRADTQIVIALDLKDVVQPHKLRAAMEKSPLVKGNPALLRKWEKIIQGIQG